MALFKMGKRTAVLWMQKFEKGTGFEFMTGIRNGLAKAKSLGLTKLVIDVSDNIGGDICAGYW